MDTTIKQTQPDSTRKAQLTEELSKIVETELQTQARQDAYAQALGSRVTARERLEIGRQQLAEYTRLAEERRKSGDDLRGNLESFLYPATTAANDQHMFPSVSKWLMDCQWQEWRLSYMREFILELTKAMAAEEACFDKFCSTNGWPAPTA